MSSSLTVFCCALLPCFLLCWNAVASLRREWLGHLLLGFSLLLCALVDVRGLAMLCAMTCVNYAFGLALAAPGEREDGMRRKGILLAAATANVLPLCFLRLQDQGFAFLSLASPPAPAHAGAFTLASPLLPGLAFWMLIQIGWLASIYRRQVEPEGFLRHAVFSCAFPHLFAGPIVRYEQMGRQYDGLAPLEASNVAAGLMLLGIGLCKKCLLADQLDAAACAVFAAASQGAPLGQLEAWAGTLSFTFQIYFDFSGYMDIVSGAALMAGVRLPQNFSSPLRATGFIEFWRRWHITLSSWIKDFVYTPLGGEWCGPARQLLSFACAMLVCGLWHGFHLTFLVWALMNGVFLLVNYLFRKAVSGRPLEELARLAPCRMLFGLATFLLLNACFAMFRADSPAAAIFLYSAMAGLAAEGNAPLPGLAIGSWSMLFPLVPAMLATLLLPASREFVAGRRDGGRAWLAWSMNGFWAAVCALGLFASLVLAGAPGPFIF
ncbi:MAG: MBOAT family protein [Desulfovibrio sp.]|jgi:alginate O-acetyltransferase complex protein AlgI|nr:MBOAT family protein [Desulfovibrio sp.]MCR5169717.1 MBOAT family protein [Desulfovibrio sp.]